VAPVLASDPALRQLPQRQPQFQYADLVPWGISPLGRSWSERFHADHAAECAAPHGSHRQPALYRDAVPWAAVTGPGGRR
jgi:hypothetical protein